MNSVSTAAEVYQHEKKQEIGQIIQFAKTIDIGSIVKLVKSQLKSKGRFIPTLNHTGFMSTELDSCSQEFINFAKHKQEGKVLEIGTAYGICGLAALSQGIKITCSDIEEQHLAILQDIATLQGWDANLSLVPGNFPNQIHFEANTFDAILISRVLHLFDGTTIRKSLMTAKKWLKPNGKLFVVVDTPYLKNLQPFIPIYEERVKRKEEWPGLLHLDECGKFITNLSDEWPTLVNFLDVDVLGRELSNAGFDIESLHTMGRPDFPSDRILDNRENVGAIARKLP